MYYIIFDLEMTMWATKVFKMEDGYVVYDKKRRIVMEKPIQEVIEIGAIKLNEFFNPIETFSMFVRPRYCPVTTRCTQLTGITQLDVEHSPQFRKAMNKFAEWIMSTGDEYSLYSWSDSDKKQILVEVNTKGIGKDFPILECLNDKHYIDLQKEFSFLCGRDRNHPIALKKAMKLLNLDFHQEHRALSDSIAVADILTEMIGSWQDKLNLTQNMEEII